MLDTIREAGREIGRGLGRTWESLSDGWHELVSRSGMALTHFSREPDEALANAGATRFPRWGLLAGEIEETDKDILARLELPGMDKADFRVTIEGNVLNVSGQKRYERETSNSTYHVMECAYGAFERSIPLPGNVDAEKAAASYKDGVLRIRLPKVTGEGAKTIRVR
jgi:HSP20 family protein